MNNPGEPRRFLAIAGGAALTIAVGWIVLGLRGAEPQLEADEDVFQTVDALFTAVTSRDIRRVADCQARLDKLRDEERLPESAATVLDDVIRQAHAEDWEPAARRLYDFMLAQRRE